MSQPSDKLAYSVGEVTELTGLGRSTVLLQIKAGGLRARKCGDRTLILAEDLRAWLEGLPNE